MFMPAVIQVVVPESWSMPESLGLFALAALIFAVMIRRKMLRFRKP